MSTASGLPSRERLKELLTTRDFATLTAIPYEQDGKHLERLKDLFEALSTQRPPSADTFQSAEDVVAMVKFTLRCVSLYQWSLGLLDFDSKANSVDTRYTFASLQAWLARTIEVSVQHEQAEAILDIWQAMQRLGGFLADKPKALGHFEPLLTSLALQDLQMRSDVVSDMLRLLSRDAALLATFAHNNLECGAIAIRFLKILLNAQTKTDLDWCKELFANVFCILNSLVDRWPDIVGLDTVRRVSPTFPKDIDAKFVEFWQLFKASPLKNSPFIFSVVPPNTHYFIQRRDGEVLMYALGLLANPDLNDDDGLIGDSVEVLFHNIDFVVAKIREEEKGGRYVSKLELFFDGVLPRLIDIFMLTPNFGVEKINNRLEQVLYILDRFQQCGLCLKISQLGGRGVWIGTLAPIAKFQKTLAPSGNGTAEEERCLLQLFAVLVHMADYPVSLLPNSFCDNMFIHIEVAIRVSRERFARGAVCCKGAEEEGHETNPLLQPLYVMLFTAVSEVFARRWTFQQPRFMSIVNGIVPSILEKDMSLDANILALACASRLSDFAVGQRIQPPKPLVADLRKKALEIVRRSQQTPPLMRRHHHSGKDLEMLASALSGIATLGDFTDLDEFDGFARYVPIVFEWVLAHKAGTDDVSQLEAAEVALPGLALLGCLCVDARKLDAFSIDSMRRAFDLFPGVMDFLASLDTPSMAAPWRSAVGSGLAWGLSILSLFRKPEAVALCSNVMRRMKSPKSMELNGGGDVPGLMLHADICAAITNILPFIRQNPSNKSSVEVMDDLPWYLTLALTAAKEYHVAFRDPTDSMVAPILIALIHFTYDRRDRERFTSNVNNWRVLVEWYDVTYDHANLLGPIVNPDLVNVIRSLSMENVHRDEMVQFVQGQARTRPNVKLIEIGLVGTSRLNLLTVNTPSYRLRRVIISNFLKWMRIAGFFTY